MIKDNIEQLFTRDLNKLKSEIEAYKNESEIWQVSEGISNSAGNLCLHLLGNLNNFIGGILGNSGYVRNREEEFSLKNVPRTDLVQEISKLTALVENTLNSLTDEQLEANYPENVLGSPMSTRQFLIHLYGHLNYHLGQVNYHRRILAGHKATTRG